MSILGTDNIESTRIRKIALAGFDGPAMASLDLFLSKESGLRIVGIDKADLLIVNGDQGIHPEELKATYTQQYSKPGILISVRDLSWPGFVLLKRPYSSNDLIEAIRSQSVFGAGSDDAYQRAESRVAAVMGIEAPAGSSRSEAYDAYMARVGAGQEAMGSLQNEKQRAEQHKQQLRDKLRRGKEATRRVAEKALMEQRNKQPAGTENHTADATVPPGNTDSGKIEQAYPNPDSLRNAEDEVRELLRQAEEAQRIARENAELQQLEAQLRVESARKELERIEEQKREEKRKEVARIEAERREAARQLALRKAAEKRAAEKKAIEERKALEIQAAEKRAAEQKALAKREALIKKQAEMRAAEKAARARAEAEALAQARTAAQASVPELKTQSAVPKGELKLIPDEALAVKNKAAAKPAAKSARTSTAAIHDEEMIYRCCGNLADVDVARPDERRRIYFNTDGALLYWLPLAVKKARLTDTPVEISGLPRCFVYLPDEDRFFCDFGEDLLLQYALSRFGFGELDLGERLDLAVSRPEPTSDKKIVESRDAMIWKIALWTARGRLNQRMDPEKVYKLKERPDFSRLIETPHASAITELWFGHRLSALDIVRILNIPQRYVFAFMSGADALGWLQE